MHLNKNFMFHDLFRLWCFMVWFMYRICFAYDTILSCIFHVHDINFQFKKLKSLEYMYSILTQYFFNIAFNFILVFLPLSNLTKLPFWTNHFGILNLTIINITQKNSISIFFLTKKYFAPFEINNIILKIWQ